VLIKYLHMLVMGVKAAQGGADEGQG
jgi:hypothetical protein